MIVALLLIGILPSPSGAQVSGDVAPVPVVIEFVTRAADSPVDSAWIHEVVRQALEAAGARGARILISRGTLIEPIPFRHLRIGLEMYSGGEVRYRQIVRAAEGSDAPRRCYSLFISQPRPPEWAPEAVRAMLRSSIECAVESNADPGLTSG